MSNTRLHLRLLACVLFLVSSQLHATAEETFRVCSWNIENFGVTDRVIAGKHVKEAMKPDSEIDAVMAIIKKINPDILGIMEMLQAPDDKYIKLFREKLAAAGVDLPFLSTTKGEDNRIQNILLSRYPFAKEEPFNQDTFEVTKLSPTGEKSKATWRVSRGFVHAVVNVRPDYPVHVILVHLKSKRTMKEVVSDDPNEKGEDILRKQEAGVLRRHLLELIKEQPDARIISMGDYNDTIKSPTMLTVIPPKSKEPRLRELFLKDYLGDWWTYFSDYDKGHDRIDFIVVNEPLFRTWVRDQSYIYRNKENDPPVLNAYEASDHRPLVSVFKIAGPSSGTPAPAEATAPADKEQ